MLKFNFKRSCLFTIIILLCFYQIAMGYSIIGESLQTTATERNNARLILEDNIGTLHVVYYDNGIHYSKSTDNGLSWSPDEELTTIGRNPSIAVDSNNILHLVYKYGGIAAYNIVHQTCDEGVWSAIDTVYYGEVIEVSRPVIKIDSSNNLHCIWQVSGAATNSEIFYKKHTIFGWDDTKTNISNSYGASEYPTLTIDSNNNVYAFWKDSGEIISNPKMVLFRKCTAGGIWDTTYTAICTTIVDDDWATMAPCAIIDSEDNIHLVWKDSRTGTAQVYYLKCTDGIWDTDTTNISNTGNTSAKPIISINENDDLFVVWEEKTDGIYYDIVYKTLENGATTWSEMVNISNTAYVDSRYPSMPRITNNSLYTIWTEGETHPYSITFNRIGLVGIDNLNQPIDIVSDYQIKQNYPNPFNPNTTIQISIPNTEYITLKIYSSNGELIRTLDEGVKTSGLHNIHWDGTDELGKSLSSGIYFYKLTTESGISLSKSMILLK